jgi:glycosyltransferase involved in cell wall biosynthesis
MEVAPSSGSPKKILYVITKSNWGGAQRYVYDLAVAGTARGYQVTVAAGGNGELIARLADAGVEVFPIPGFIRDISLAGEVSAFFSILRLMRTLRPDVAHLNSSKAGLAALAARLAGVKRIIFTVHGWAWNEERPRWQKFLIACVYFVTLVLCHTVIVVSRAAQSQGQRLPLVSKKMRVIHNGVHPIDFLSRQDARAHLIPESRCSFWIGTIAELHPVKGLSVLIEAFEHFLVDYPDAQLVIIGEGQERGALERQMNVEGVYERACLAGHVPDAGRYLPAFDVFVLPSRSEGLGYVLLEAGLASLSVVASNVGGIPEIVVDGETGVLVPPGDREALTYSLRELAGNDATRRALAANLHAKVEREFSLDRMIEQTFSLY